MNNENIYTAQGRMELIVNEDSSDSEAELTVEDFGNPVIYGMIFED